MKRNFSKKVLYNPLMGCSPLANSRFQMGVTLMGFAEHFGLRGPAYVRGVHRYQRAANVFCCKYFGGIYPSCKDQCTANFWVENISGQQMSRRHVSLGGKFPGGKCQWAIKILAANVWVTNVSGRQMSRWHMSVGGKCLGGKCQWTANVCVAYVIGR